MKLKQLRSKDWRLLKPNLLLFVQRYGENRITSESLRLFRSLQPKDLSFQQGNQICIGTDHNRLIAVSFLKNYGKDASIIVVSPSHRGKQLAKQLLQKHISQLSAVFCQVAQDNTACKNACMHAGLRPVKVLAGPAGKPSLLFSNVQEETFCKHQH